MIKLSPKILKDKIKRKSGDGKPPKSLITSDNIEEHREATLESGRKFKYPLHISMQKILVNAAIIFGIAALLFGTFSWWRLYIVQDVSDFFYTATQIVPIPVASVDGKWVRYGDYMRRLRASVFYLENQENRDFNTEDGRREMDFTRRQNMNEAQKVTFAYKIAAEENLSVSEDEIDANIQATLDSGVGGSISARAYENSLRRYFGWSMNDYRHIVRDRLMVRKAAFAIDTAARTRINEAAQKLSAGSDFGEIAKQFSDDKATSENGGAVGAVSLNSVDQNGLLAAAKGMQIGQISGVIEGIDAFYIIRLTEKTDTAVKYSMIKVDLREFEKRFEQLRTDGLISEFINIKSD